MFLALFLVPLACLLVSMHATAATDSTINFQARLMTAGGGIVPDGNYNVEFKLYNASTSSGSSQGSCTGDANCLWTETRTGANQVRVANGYLTVSLGSVSAFPSINWDQSLWLTMNIGGTSGSPVWDGEMSPRLQLTAVPYAFRAGQLAQYNSGTGFTSTLNIVQPTGGNQIFNIPDQGAAGTYTLLTTSAASTGYVQLQGSTPGTAQTGNFNINGVGVAGTLEASIFDAPSGSTVLNLATGSNATSIVLGRNASFANGSDRMINISTATSGAGNTLTLQGGGGASGNNAGGGLTLQGGAATGTATGGLVTLQGGAGGTGVAALGGNVLIQGGTANGTGASSGGNITLQGGTPAGTGTKGLITINGGLIYTTVAYSSAVTATITQSNVDSYTTILATATATNLVFTVPSPTVTTAGRMLNITNVGTNPFTLIAGSLSYILSAGNTAVLVWSGSTWTSAGASSLQAAYGLSTGGSNATPTIKLINGIGDINIQDADGGLGGGNFLSLRSQNASGLGSVVFGFGIKGQFFEQPSTDTATAFQIENHSNGNTLFAIDTAGDVTNTAGYINIGTTGGSTGGTGSAYNGAAVNIQTSPNANTLTNIGSTVETGSATATINIGYTNTSGGGSVVNIGSGTGASNGTTTVRSNTTLTLTAGTASTWSTVAGALTLQGAGGININTGNVANTIQIGSTTLSSGTQTINIGNNGTPGGVQAVTIGSLLGTSTTLIQGGTGTSAISLTPGTNGSAIVTTTGSGNIKLISGASVIAQSTNNNNTAFQVLNSTGGYVLNVDTQNSVIGLVLLNTGVYGGNGGYIDTYYGSAGIAIGNTNAGSVAIGNTSANTAVTLSSSTTVVAKATGTNAFQIQNASGTALLNYSTSQGVLTTYGGNLTVNGVANPAAPSLTTTGTGGSLAANTYYYRLDAIGTDGSSTTASIPSSPGSVTTTGSTSKNTLSWTAVPYATGYDIYRSIDGGNTWFFNQVSSSTTSIVDNGSTYTWTAGSSVSNLNTAGGINLQTGTGLILDGGASGTYHMQLFDNVNGGNTLTLANYNSGGSVDIQGQNVYLTDTSTYNHDFTLANTGAITLKSNTASLASAFSIQNSTGVSMFNVNTSTSSERITIGPSGGDSIGEVLILGNKTGSSADPTQADGGIYYNATSRSFRCGMNGVWRSCIGGLVNSSTAASSAVAATVTKTNFTGGTNNSYTTLANDCQPGVVYNVTAQGVYSNSITASTLTFALTVDGTSTNLVASGAIPTVASASNAGWGISAQIICDTTGTSGTVEVQGEAMVSSNTASAGVSAATGLMANSTTQTLNTTTTHTLALAVTWGANTSGNTATMRQFIVQRLGP